MGTLDNKLQRGRPAGPTELVRSHRLVTFVTEAEFDRMSQLASADNKSLSATAYDLLMHGLRTTSKIDNN
ncbi:hypothetical protein [Oceanicoccus sagamiensis]|uniref:CopG family transcriptional regulator n=1 Tax=Oceanicoccus sagamiensis TaxID=716816 RepID=A0A1X9N4Y3_9GAMM|nr:hypothetical protein [Oceanicoccus sagamiensis]ARN73188.1 hypothetical protein BST96_03150 [Oceanicoccus sagamiensis]